MTRPLRCLVYIGLAVFVIIAGTGQSAGAHAGAVLTIHSDGAGAIWVTARWTDGHPVTEPASAIITAAAATGQRVGPAPLRAADDGMGTLTYSGQLPPGRWTVTVEMARPAVARCESQVDARQPATPTTVTCTPEQAQTATAPADGGPTAWLSVAALIAAAAIVIPLALWRIARQSRRTRPARNRGRSGRP